MTRPTTPLLVGLFVAAIAPLGAQQIRVPNILILYADDLGYGDLAAQNAGSKIPTPNLDRLAREGLRFTDGHSSSGICSPSRYAMLTGRYHWRDFHSIVGPFGPSKFRAERLTLPEMLRSRGYATACIGKWHLGWDWAAIRKPGAEPVKRGRHTVWGPDAFDWTKSIPDGPLAHGFEHYFGDSVINFPPYCWIRNDRVVEPPDAFMETSKWKKIKEGGWECRPGPMITGWDPYQNLPTITAEAVEYIQAQQESREEARRPFFLYVPFPSPHAPIIPNDRFDGKSGAGPYGDFVVETDDACGQILRALKKSGLADDTIVIFTADNGPEHYAYARDEKFEHWSAEPFRGLKRDIYEGGHHVPFLVRWPGVIEAGRRSDALVSQVDLMATLAAVVGFKLPDDAAEDSHDLAPLLRGHADAIRTSHVHNTRENEYAIRHENWLLVVAKSGYGSRRNPGWEARREFPADDDQPVELYDLSKDIGQRRNVARSHPDRVHELQALLDAIRTRGHSAPRLETR